MQKYHTKWEQPTPFLLTYLSCFPLMQFHLVTDYQGIEFVFNLYANWNLKSAMRGKCLVVVVAFLIKLSLLWVAGIGVRQAAKPNGSESSGTSNWVKRRTSICSALPLLLVMDHLHGTTQGLRRYSNFFFGNFIVRQPAFWVCCYHCSQLMFLHCSWQALFSRTLLG